MVYPPAVTPKEALSRLSEEVGGSPELQSCVRALRDAVQESDARGSEADRYRELLTRSVQIAGNTSLDPVAGDLLDALMAVVDAPRGFFGVSEQGGGWRIVAGRNLGESGHFEASSGIIQRAMASADPVVEVDA